MEKPNRNNNNNKKCGSDVVRGQKKRGKGKENIPPPDMPAVAPEPEWLTRAAGGEAVAVPRTANEEREALDELVAGTGSEEVLDGEVRGATATHAIAPGEAREGFHLLPSTSSDEGQLPRSESTQMNQVPATAQPCAVAQDRDITCEFPDVAPATGQWSWGSLRVSHGFAAPAMAGTLRPVRWGEEQLTEEVEEEDEGEEEDYLL